MMEPYNMLCSLARRIVWLFFFFFANFEPSVKVQDCEHLKLEIESFLKKLPVTSAFNQQELRAINVELI